MAIEEWDNIQPRSDACNGCQKPFADKEDYHTLLTLTREGYQRRDLCVACWGQGFDRTTAVSYWQGVFQMPPPPKPETLKREDAESLLRKFIDSPDPGHGNVRYILAVMLERKRTLKHRDTTERDGQKILIYEHMRTGETLLIPDPRLRLDQLEHVQAEVAALLAPPAPPAQPAQSAQTSAPSDAPAAQLDSPANPSSDSAPA